MCGWCVGGVRVVRVDHLGWVRLPPLAPHTLPHSLLTRYHTHYSLTSMGERLVFIPIVLNIPGADPLRLPVRTATDLLAPLVICWYSTRRRTCERKRTHQLVAGEEAHALVRKWRGVHPLVVETHWALLPLYLQLKALFHNPLPPELRKIESSRFSLVPRARTWSWQGLGHRIVE